mmetsp:Transcript_10312/g.18918  ORF Transcript_10312/g.18918 Transcript_10312/m.18918 type:complete len:210 (-) Transcript_10312:13-642(-)
MAQPPPSSSVRLETSTAPNTAVATVSATGGLPLTPVANKNVIIIIVVVFGHCVVRRARPFSLRVVATTSLGPFTAGVGSSGSSQELGKVCLRSLFDGRVHLRQQLHARPKQRPFRAHDPPAALLLQGHLLEQLLGLAVHERRHDFEDELNDEGGDVRPHEIRVHEQHKLGQGRAVGLARQRDDLGQVLGVEPRALRRGGGELARVRVLP